MKLLRSLNFLFKRWVLRKPFLIAETDFFDLRLKARVDDMHGRHLYTRGAHDAALTRALIDRLELRSGDVALDIGSNLGWYSLILDRIAPDGVDIFAFEPDSLNLDLLRENLELNGARKVTPIHAALAEAEGRRQLHLYKSSNRGRHSLLPVHDGAFEEVWATTLDGFWEERGLGDRVPAFIKLDVEGYELFVLRGGAQVLSRCRSLLMEYSPALLRKAGLRPAELLETIAATGMRPQLCARVSTNELGPVDLDEVIAADAQCNILWGY